MVSLKDKKLSEKVSQEFLQGTEGAASAPATSFVTEGLNQAADMLVDKLGNPAIGFSIFGAGAKMLTDTFNEEKNNDLEI